MTSKTNPYRIWQALNLKIKVESADDSRARDIKNELIDLIEWTEKTEAFFDSIKLWEVLNDPETGKTLTRSRTISGQWYVSKLDEIEKLVDEIRIGKPPVSLEEALETVKDQVEQYRTEKARQAEVAVRYDESIDTIEILSNETEHNTFKVMRAQSELDRNRLLEEIRDELKTVSGALKDIGTKMKQ